MRAVYIGVELSNGLVFRGLIKTRERNSLMKDSREYAIATRLQNHGDKSDRSITVSVRKFFLSYINVIEMNGLPLN